MPGRRLAISLVLVAILVVSVFVLPNSTWRDVTAGLLGGLLVAGIFASPARRPPDELDVLKPLEFAEGEGDWQVRLESYGQPKVLTVLSRSFGVSLASALPMLSDLPTVLISGVREENARELVDRLGRAGATAVAVRTPA